MTTRLRRSLGSDQVMPVSLTRFDTPGKPAGKPVTTQEIEAIQEQARREAWEEGYALGREEGARRAFEEHSKHLRQKIDVLQRIVRHSLPALQEVGDEVTDELTRLAIGIAEQLLQTSLAWKPELISEIVRNCLALLPATVTEMVVELNPQDAALVREELSGVLESNGLRVQEQLDMRRGDCLVRCRYSEVDARLQPRIDKIVESLLGEPPGPGTAESVDHP